MNEMDKLRQEAEIGRKALIYLNYLQLRQEEDREHLADVRRVARELGESRRKGAAA